MEVNRLSRGDYAVLAGFVVGIIGVSLSWYAVVDHYTAGTLRYAVHGWAYTLGWLSWVCLLAAALAVVVGSGVVSQFRVDLGRKAPLVVMGLGGLATVLVLIGFATKPSVDSLAVYVVAHMNSAMLTRAQTASREWGDEVVSSGFGAGIVLSLIAGAAVTLGGYLKVKDAGIALFAAPTVSAAGATAAPTVTAAAASAASAPAAVAPVGPANEAAPASAPASQGPANAAAPASAAASPVGFCGQCGAQFAEDDAKFCARCGAPRPAIGDTEATR